MVGKYEYWESMKNRQWYWHLKASNGRVVAQSEGYVTKRCCLNGIKAAWNASITTHPLDAIEV